MGDHPSSKPSGLPSSGGIGVDAIATSASRRIQTGSPFLHSRMRRGKGAIFITRSICICKRGSSQSGATIGQDYSLPPVGLKRWKGKEVLIPLRMRFFLALWSQPRRTKVDLGLLQWQKPLQRLGTTKLLPWSCHSSVKTGSKKLTTRLTSFCLAVGTSKRETVVENNVHVRLD